MLCTWDNSVIFYEVTYTVLNLFNIKIKKNLISSINIIPKEYNTKEKWKRDFWLILNIQSFT